MNDQYYMLAMMASANCEVLSSVALDEGHDWIVGNHDLIVLVRDGCP
jgi:hypothetical protein